MITYEVFPGGQLLAEAQISRSEVSLAEPPTQPHARSNLLI